MKVFRKSAPAPSASAPSERSPVFLCLHGGLPRHTKGFAQRMPDGRAGIYLSRHTVDGLHANDRDAWLTVFHEAAHVVFGDIDNESAGDEHEARAEAFAEFMLDLCGRSLALKHIEGADAQRLVPGMARLEVAS